MAYIKLTTRVNGAVTISGSQMTGNHIDSSSWITGSTLRGALAAHWSGEKDETFLNFFCRGDVFFSGLFPLPSDAYEQKDFLANDHFPFRISKASSTCKYQPWAGGGFTHSIINRVGGNISECTVCKAPVKQVKNYDFYYPKGSDQMPIRQTRETYLYHGTDRTTRRAMDAALYSQTSISDGEGFIGWLAGDRECLEKMVTRLKSSPHASVNDNGNLFLPLSVGRGKKRRGYLETVFHPVADNYPGQREVEASLLPSNKRIIVVLQTPAICCDSLFCPQNDLSAGDLFGDIALEKEDNGTFSEMTMIEGWSNIHGLPRKPDQALAAGSTFVFKVAGKDPADEEIKKRLKSAIKNGVGERRLEGYGQFTINPPMVRIDNGR